VEAVRGLMKSYMEDRVRYLIFIAVTASLLIRLGLKMEYLTEMQQRVLLAIYGNDKVILRKLIELTKSSTAPVNNAVKSLKEWGLVEEIEETGGFPKRRYIKLTEKGKRAVEKLKELYSLIEASS
jgi:DNA-binding MarR family transcriptional regulator